MGDADVQNQCQHQQNHTGLRQHHHSGNGQLAEDLRQAWQAFSGLGQAPQVKDKCRHDSAKPERYRDEVGRKAGAVVGHGRVDFHDRLYRRCQAARTALQALHLRRQCAGQQLQPGRQLL